MTKIVGCFVCLFFFCGASQAVAQNPPAPPAADATDVPVVVDADALSDLSTPCDRAIQAVLARMPRDSCPSLQEWQAIRAEVTRIGRTCSTQFRRQRESLIEAFRRNLRNNPQLRQTVCGDGRVSDADLAAIFAGRQRRRGTGTGRRTPPRVATPTPAPVPTPAPSPPVVVCDGAYMVALTSSGCQCVQDGQSRVLLDRYDPRTNVQAFACPLLGVPHQERAEQDLAGILAAQAARDAAQDARMDGIVRDQRQRDADQDRDIGNAREIAERVLSERPSSIEERWHFDLLAGARLVVPGLVGDGAPMALGTGLGLRLRWRCNACGQRSEFYWSLAGGLGVTGQDVGTTAYGETGIGYLRYLDANRVVALSVGALAYGFGLMGREPAPTETGIHGDLRRWGVGGEILFDLSLTGGSPPAHPTRTEVRLQVGVGVTYDTAYWWDQNSGLRQSRGIGFIPTVGLVFNP